MKILKFDNFNESSDEQLKMGIKIESEHLNVYEYFDKFLKENNLEMPISKNDLYEMIAKAHIEEIPDYYDRLSKMENESNT